MVVVSLVAIFAGLALPNFLATIESSRVQSGATSMFRLMQMARSDAVSTRSPLTLCPSNANLQWVLVRASSCAAPTSSTTSQNLQLPDTLTVSSSVSSLTFKPDGTAAAANLGFSSSGTTRAFTVSVVASGYISLTGGSGR
jgi:Tfp pilus assembly protein FimT